MLVKTPARTANIIAISQLKVKGTFEYQKRFYSVYDKKVDEIVCFCYDRNMLMSFSPFQLVDQADLRIERIS